LFCLVLGLMGICPRLSAHELQPGYLELRQTGAETFQVLWKIPARNDLWSGVRPVLPDGILSGTPRTYQSENALMERYEVRFPGGIEGRSLQIQGASAKLFDVLIRVVRLDGAAQIFRLTPAVTAVVVPAASRGFQGAADFFRLGVDHILMGVDHLLFVLGLLLIVRDRRMLVKAITSFTVAHSLTLAVATLGYASAPTLPLNAGIALSILFLGPEIVRLNRGESSLTIRHQWVVAFVFGLLHGFGFASGLTALGLGHSEIPLALLCFNLGVEAGQLLFVLLILSLERSFRILEIRWAAWAEQIPCYTVGTLGAFWTIQRTIMLLEGRL